MIVYTTSIRSVRPRFIIHNLLAPEKISNASLDSFHFYFFFYTIVSDGCLQMFKIFLFIRSQFPHQFRHNFDWYINKYNASYPHIVHMFLRIQLKHVLDNECYQTIYHCTIYKLYISAVCYCATLCLINAPSFNYVWSWFWSNGRVVLSLPFVCNIFDTIVVENSSLLWTIAMKIGKKNWTTFPMMIRFSTHFNNFRTKSITNVH